MTRLLSTALALLFAISCTEKNRSFDNEIQDTGEFEQQEIPVDDTGSEIETDTISIPKDSDTASALGELGDLCWISAFPSGHPNLGYPDCDPALNCIGDKDDGWCTKTCRITGTVSEEKAIDGWCCGEIGRACNPSRFWMPPSMAKECAPRDIPLGEPCEPSGAARCKPACSGTTETFQTACASNISGRFCTHTRDSHFDCIEDSTFANGCCANISGATYCQKEVTDACIVK